MEEKECPEKKEGRGALAAAELIRQPWAAMPRQVLQVCSLAVDVRQQEGAAAKGV